MIACHANSTYSIEARGTPLRAAHTGSIDKLQALGAGSADSDVSWLTTRTTDDAASTGSVYQGETISATGTETTRVTCYTVARAVRAD
jgi:hypothetical protein